MSMRACPFCAEEIQDAAIKCKHCGSQLVDAGGSHSLVATLDVANLSAERRTTVTAILGIAAGVLMAIGPFLPFLSSWAGSASGLQTTGNRAFSIVSGGVIVTLLGIFGVILRKRFALWYVLNGASAAALMWYYQRKLEEQIGTSETNMALGAGVYVCYLGSVLAVVAGALCVEFKSGGNRDAKPKYVRLVKSPLGSSTQAQRRAS